MRLGHSRFSTRTPARRLIAAPALLAAILALPTPRAHAESWTNSAADGIWSNPLNWTPNLPASGAAVTNATITPITLNTNATLASLVSNGPFTLSATLAGSQPNAAAPIQVNNLLTFNGGGLSGVTLNAGVSGAVSVASNAGNFIVGSILNTALPVNAGYLQFYGTSTLKSQLTLFPGGQLLFHDGSANLSLTTAASLHGAGLINEFFAGSTLTNAGTLSADMPGQTLSLNTSNITGPGVFQALSGATLSIGGLFNATNASIHADTGTVLINAGGLTGTTASATGTGFSFSSNANNYLSNATINGNLTLPSTAYAQAYGTNAVSGIITMSSTSNGFQLRDSSASLLLTPTALLHGFGTVYETFGGSTLIANGTISADSPGAILRIANSKLTGSGTLDARGGGILSLATLLNGSALHINVDANPLSTVVLNGGGLTGSIASTTGTGLSFANNPANSISSATVNGTLTFPEGGYAQVFGTNTLQGTINMSSFTNGIQLRDSSATLSITSTGKLRGNGTIYQTFAGAKVLNAGLIAADAPGKTLSFLNDVVITSGTVRVDPVAAMSVSGTFTQTAGLTTLDGGLTLASPFALQGGTLNGNGFLTGSVNNTAGLVSPGHSAGRLSLSGNYAQTSTAALEIELGGYAPGSSYDQLSVTGTANLAGNLNVDLVSGFLPQIGDTFNILTRNGGTGAFSTTTSANNGLTYSVAYNPSNIQITITSLPGVAAPVPEPSSLLLLLATTPLLLRRKRP